MRPPDHVPGRADVGDHVALLDFLSGAKPSGISGQVAVEEEVSAARVLLVDRDPAAPFPDQLDDLPVRRRQDRRSPRGADVDGEVASVLAPRLEEGIAQLVAIDAFDGEQEVRGQELGQQWES